MDSTDGPTRPAATGEPGEPTTAAGRWLLQDKATEWEPARKLWRGYIAAIEEEAAANHEAALKERGWQDEFEVATAAAMNFGEGSAEAGRRWLRADLAARRHREAEGDRERQLTEALRALLKVYDPDDDPNHAWPVVQFARRALAEAALLARPVEPDPPDIAISGVASGSEGGHSGNREDHATDAPAALSGDRPGRLSGRLPVSELRTPAPRDGEGLVPPHPAPDRTLPTR